jgi:dsDNA-specific endonuclease/ATPase MutS2
MATLDTDDLQKIKQLIEVSLGEVVETTLVTKDDLGYLPTKDEFYTKMDEVMGELKATREEVAIRSHQVADHEDRIEKIENHLGISSN